LDQPSLNSLLIPSNGDAQLWLRMCTISNPSPVHVIQWNDGHPNLPATSDNGTITFSGLGFSRFVTPEYYAANATTVGDENGGVISLSGPASDGGLASDDWPEWPWCIDASGATPAPPAGLPLCPPAVSQLVRTCGAAYPESVAGCLDEAGANRWAVRGAMNAGFSAYLYIKSLETLANPPPDFTQCDLLP
jgi:hypothetical protein